MRKYRPQTPITFTGGGVFVVYGGDLVRDEPLLHTDVAAHAAGVTESTIGMWASRGWKDPVTGERRYLEVAKRDWQKRPMYRYADVMAAEKATRRRGRSRKRINWPALDVNSSGMSHAC
jgi:hypothetical protein